MSEPLTPKAARAPSHPHDGYAYDGCQCVCCVNVRALADHHGSGASEGLREVQRYALEWDEVYGQTNMELDPTGRWCLFDEVALDPRVVEAFDLLGGMWSWSEDNGYLRDGNTWPILAGRLLREVVGRPAREPGAAESSEGETP